MSISESITIWNCLSNENRTRLNRMASASGISLATAMAKIKAEATSVTLTNHIGHFVPVERRIANLIESTPISNL